MKVLIPIVIGLLVVGCGKKEKSQAKTKVKNPESTKAVSNKLIADPIVEKAIRKRIHKTTGVLTKTDLEKVTWLDLYNYQLTDVKGLEKLTQLTELNLYYNRALTKAQIDELQKALPKCQIRSNPKK